MQISKKHSTSKTPDRRSSKKEELAHRLEELLRWSGMSDEEIEQMRGGEERTGFGWQRLAKAVVQNRYQAMGTDGALGNAVRPAMSEGLRFAWEGASTLQEVAYRYEYFKALYDTEKTKILDEHKDMPKSNKLKMASDRMIHPSKDPQENLDSDIKVIHEMHSGKKIDIDLDQSDEEIISSLRRQAEEVGMGHDISTAYHARKHAHLIPEEEQEGHPVRTYLSSLRKTVKEGEVKNFRRL